MDAPGVNPAAAPPTTIGPYTNVPAPGSPVRSDWPQQLTTDVVNLLLTRVGVGVFAAGYSVGAGSNPTLPWAGEAYDTHGFHAAGSTDLIVPASWSGVFALSYSVTMAGAATAVCLVRLLLPGGSIRQNNIPVGQTMASVAYTGPLAVGQVVQASFWNANAAAVAVNANLEMLRVAA
jgi:hypothetical protein